MVRSVKEVLRCPVVQMSDLKTPEVAGVDRVQRIPFIRELMPYRFEHMIALGDAEVLFLDSDVIVRKDVSDVFANRFDVALTVRPQRQRVPLHMPYNTGVIFSRCQAFWQAALEYTLTLDATAQRWYADQYATAKIAGTDRFDVRELPCATYNWSPESKDDVNENAKIIHYKGALRKPWMPR